MPVQKNKPLPGFGNAALSQNGASQNFMHPRSIAGKKVDNVPHSSYFLFDDDEDYLTTLGRNDPKYTEAPKAGIARKRG